MPLKTDPRVVEQVVQFVTRDPRADGDVMLRIIQRFRDTSNDNYDGAINHMLRMLRTYVALDDAEAQVKPRAEAIPTRKRKRRRKRKSGQLDLFR